MIDNTVYLTQEGYDKIIAELKELKEVKRPEIAERLKEAISQGDLSENAESDLNFALSQKEKPVLCEQILNLIR